MQEILNGMLVWQPSYTGFMVEVFIIFLLFIGYKYFSKNGFFIIFELFFEKIYEFFEEILGKETQRWIKVYITIMFFIIIISNLLGLILEFFNPIIGREKVEAFIQIPTGDINFNIAMATVGVIIIIMEQFKTLGFWKTIHEYVPIKGKDLIPFERGKLPVAIDYLVFGIIKFFDITISLFLGLLDIIGHAAKVVSLSFRLFGNMMSGGILIAMLIGGITALTSNLFGIEFPALGPIILYLQGILVAVIQALVFPLLIAIFIKVAKMEG